MFETVWGIQLFAFIAVTTVIYMVVEAYGVDYWRVRSRVKYLRGGGENSTADRPTQSSWPMRLFDAVRQLGDPQASGVSPSGERLRKAGLSEPNAQLRILGMRGACAVAFFLLTLMTERTGFLSLRAALFAACFVASIGWFLPTVWINQVIKQRQAMFRQAVPDFIDLIIVCLDAGMSLQDSIRRVGDELRIVHPGLAHELDIVQQNVELGDSIGKAIHRMANRTSYDGLRTLSTFIREAQRFGTNITEAMRNHAEIERLKREQAAEEMAQKASVKILFPTLLLIMPALFVVLVGPALIQIREAFAQ